MPGPVRLVTWSIRAALVWMYYRFGWYRAAWKGVRVDWAAHVSPHAVIDGVVSLGTAVVGKNVVIGRGTYVSSGTIQTAVIGKFCSIGPNVLIGPTEHLLGHWTTSPYEALEHGEAPGTTERIRPVPRIGNSVWIGANVVILRGVTIGDRAAVAAGAVVTTHVAAGELWAGIPARRVTDEKRRHATATEVGAVVAPSESAVSDSRRKPSAP